MDVEEIALPGIGLRYDFATRSGQHVGVVCHRGGRRDLVIYDRDDPDSSREVLQLTDEEGDVLAELLGAPRIVERLADLHKEVEGLLSEQIPIAAGFAVRRPDARGHPGPDAHRCLDRGRRPAGRRCTPARDPTSASRPGTSSSSSERGRAPTPSPSCWPDG